MRLLLVNRATGDVFTPGPLVIGGLAALAFCLIFAMAYGAHQALDLLRNAGQSRVLVDSTDPSTGEPSRANMAEEQERREINKRIGEVQARLLRVEAIGNRVLDVASIPADEFDFGAVPGRGGPVVETTGSSDVVVKLDLPIVLDELERQLENSEVQLIALRELLEEQAFNLERRPIGRPTKKGWMSSRYGFRIDPKTGRRAWHTGVDYAGPWGSDVLAVAGGLVVAAETRKGYGRIVEIDHGLGLSTRYAHLAEIKVSPGDLLQRGSIVGALGSSGRSTGPHVHLEVIQNGRLVNPNRFARAPK